MRRAGVQISCLRQRSLRQVLAFIEHPQFTFVDADCRIQNAVEDVADRGVLVQKMILAQDIDEAGRVHEFEHRPLYPHQEQVAGAFAIGSQNVLQHMDATDVNLWHAQHAQQQETLIGVPLQVVQHSVFHILRSAEIKIALDFQNAKLGAGILFDVMNTVDLARQVLVLMVRHH